MLAALAVAAHAVSGGMVPDPGLTALLTVGVAAVGIALADRRRSQGAILLVLGAAPGAAGAGLTDRWSVTRTRPHRTSTGRDRSRRCAHTWSTTDMSTRRPIARTGAILTATTL